MAYRHPEEKPKNDAAGAGAGAGAAADVASALTESSSARGLLVSALSNLASTNRKLVEDRAHARAGAMGGTIGAVLTVSFGLLSEEELKKVCPPDTAELAATLKTIVEAEQRFAAAEQRLAVAFAGADKGSPGSWQAHAGARLEKGMGVPEGGIVKPKS